MSELLKDAVQLKTVCPACKRPLFSGEVMTVSGHRYVVWCPRPDCNKMSAGPNEGGFDKKSPERALKALMAKLGVDDDYEIESSEEPVETASESAEETPKKKGGKRGRKSKNENQSFVVPVGQFTMKEFCEQNETYPYKALPFFKEKGIEECGTRKTSTGRGKPAVLYEVKI